MKWVSNLSMAPPPRQRLLLQYKRRPLLPLLRRLPPQLQLQHLHQRLRPLHLQR